MAERPIAFGQPLIQALTWARSTKLELNEKLPPPVVDKIRRLRRPLIQITSTNNSAAKPAIHLPDEYLLALAWSKEYLS